jgi:hypothetical protein
MKEKKLDGRVAELKERERGKDEGIIGKISMSKTIIVPLLVFFVVSRENFHQLETEVRVLRNKEMDFFQCGEPSKECLFIV